MAVDVFDTREQDCDVLTKVQGDLGCLQISEIDSENEDKESFSDNNKNNKLSNIPDGVVNTSVSPVFGSVAIANSENVQIGNNTYFNGPVVIKQVVHGKNGTVNECYEKSENEDISTKRPTNITKPNKNTCLQNKLWYKIAFICFSAIVVIILTIILFKNKTLVITTNEDDDSTYGDLVSSPDHLRLVARTDWLAQPIHEELDKLKQPVPWVIITHTATEHCSTQSECVLQVRLMQMFHIESRSWSDIGYNFLIGGDGAVYIGRGWDSVGAHTKGYNKYSIGIAFIGTFVSMSPPKRQFEACQKLLNLGVKLKKLDHNYKLFTHNQLTSTLSPGIKVLKVIKTWPHFVQNVTDIDSLLPLD